MRRGTRSQGESIFGGGIKAGLLALVAAFLLLPSSQAAAEVIVSLDGSGAGTVTSTPSGINCSNIGSPGDPGSGSCGPVELGFFSTAELTATPGGESIFTGWSGDASDGTCNSGNANPCEFTDIGFFALFTIHATFKLRPDFPVVVTGGTSAGSSEYLLDLEGTVNPGGGEIADCHFEYGLTPKYGASVPCIPNGSGLGEGKLDKPVRGEVELEPLKPETTYHYRVVASNLSGTGEGNDRTFTTGPAPPSDCPNAAIRDRQVFGAILLPDCMALEMVSPPQKGGQPAIRPVISRHADRVRFFSVAALGGTPGGIGAGGDPYVASRDSSGWATAPTSPPVEIEDGWEPAANAQSFTPDFARWFQIGSTQSQLQLGAGRAFQAGLGGLFSPLSPLFTPVGGGQRGDITHSELRGASADHSHLFFVPGSASASYLSNDPEPAGIAAARNTYVAKLDESDQPSLELIARDRTGKKWGGNCGAQLGGVLVKGELNQPHPVERNQGAISGDGARVYFSTRAGQPQSGSCDYVDNKLRILERLESRQGTWIGPLFSSECNRAAPACSNVNGDDYFQGASSDGSLVYFTSSRQLTNSDLDADPSSATGSGNVSGSSVTEVTTNSGAFHIGQTLSGSSIPPGTTILGVSGSSPNQVLTLSNSAGASGSVSFTATTECRNTLDASENCDLYLYDTALPAGHRLVQVSAGEVTAPSPGEGANVLSGVTAISSDGSHVYFVAQGVLTNDTSPEGLSPAEGEPNLYLWNRSTEATTFIGILDPEDIGDLWGGSGILPVPMLDRDASGNVIAADGHILPFVSNAPLTVDDTDGSHNDAFLYNADTDELTHISTADPEDPDNEPFDIPPEGGQPTNIASLGTDFAESNRGVSEDGKTAVFTTAEALVPGDINGILDRYLWRDGQVYRMPGVVDSKTIDVALSPYGGTAAFPTPTPLLAQDGDTSADVYALRGGGGFPEPPEPPEPCQPDESLPGKPCQSNVEDPTLRQDGSESAGGAGNVLPKAGRCPKGKRKVHRHGRVRCVKAKKHHSRRANHKRRAGR